MLPDADGALAPGPRMVRAWGQVDATGQLPVPEDQTGSTLALIHCPGLKTIMQVSLPFGARLNSRSDPSRTSMSSTSVTVVTTFLGRFTCTPCNCAGRLSVVDCVVFVGALAIRFPKVRREQEQSHRSDGHPALSELG